LGFAQTIATLRASLWGIDPLVNSSRIRTTSRRFANWNLHGGKAIALGADVSKAADVEAMVAAASKQFGCVDILVNNACELRPIEYQPPFLGSSLACTMCVARDAKAKQP
jgi:NAD(P)-dependent dehydrogenase (short-subunit alcohol dehydrogenase family)